MLLRLRPALLRARRGPGRLQVGLDPERGVVLTGLDAADEAVLTLLDGTRDLDAVVADATGVPAARTRRIVAALEGAGLLTGAEGAARPPRADREHQRALLPDARVLSLVHPGGDGWAVLSRRWRSTVAVVGASRTGLAVALGLAGAGVGRVVLHDESPVAPGDVSPGGYRVDDVGHRRDQRSAALVRSRSPLTLTGRDGRAGPVDLAVVVLAGAVRPEHVEAVSEGAAHLPVLWREGSTVVGPLVRPGSSTCLRCVELHRTDRDPQWRRVAAQVAGRPPGSRSRPEETALAALTAATAVVQALAQLDGAARPASLSATLECSLPDGLVVRRPWDPHPACGCTWREGAAWSG